LRKRIPEAVRIGVWQTSICECVFEDLSDRRGVAPMLARQPNDLELSIGAVAHPRRRKQRIVIAPKFFLSQKIHPIDNDTTNVVADGKKAGCESFAALRFYLSCVLLDFFGPQIDMFQFERSRRAIARAGEQNEGNQGAVARLDPEEFKVWSQNLGHESILTTFSSYGEVSAYRQAEIMRELATQRQPAAKKREIAQRLKELASQLQT
jgi:hypothetical protein